MSDKIYTLEEIKQIVAPIAQMHGILAVYVFGSYSRGEATTASDIDFCIDCPDTMGMFELSSLYCDLGEALDKELDIVTVNSLRYNKNRKFVTEVNRDMVLLYEDIGKRYRSA